MKYITNEDLIDKQKLFWDEDLAHPKDKISHNVEYLSRSDISLEESLLKSYEDKENQEIIQNLKDVLSQGNPLPPLLVDNGNFLLDGYHRLLAAESLGIKSFPVIKLNRNSKIYPDD